MSKAKEKYLLVVSFLEGKNFPKRNKTKFIIEAKFDGEQLSTDPVDHQDPLEINQELAWELDKKSLQLHKLQRSCIKAVCYAVGEGFKENIGYLVIDIRSAPDGIGKPKWFTLLQPKYPKTKPTIQINIYIEDDQQQLLTQQHTPVSNVNHHDEISLTPSQKQHPIPENNLLLNSDDNNENEKLQVNLIESEGYFLIGKQTTSNSNTFILTITISSARNLLRLLTTTNTNDSQSNFHFYYKFLNNQVTTKPFNDIVSCQINGERSSIRLHATLEKLRKFFIEENHLEILFCSNEQQIAHGYFDWTQIANLLTNKSELIYQEPILIENLIKLESTDPNSSLKDDINNISTVGVQIGLMFEPSNDHGAVVLESKNALLSENNLQQKQSAPQVIFQNETATITLDSRNKESHLGVRTGISRSNNVLTSQSLTNLSRDQNIVTEEMQLKAAYELQLWKEAKEKEFEQNLKKIEAKKLQTLAEAFKQHDIEREFLVQKKIKEYNDFEILLKNSLNEVEKREKQLAINEANLARLKADQNHEYETKLLELRETSKRVQEKTDHQVNLFKLKCDYLEEEIARYKKQALEWEKKYLDKETEFARYKERENHRPEVKLQSEINLLNIERIELERKLDAMTKAKNHYKEQWSRALQEIALSKKREEANAKSVLKKQQQELEHLRLRYLAAEENDLIKSDHKSIESLKNEIEKIKLNTQKRTNRTDNELGSASSSDSIEYFNTIDSNLQEHINRLKEERDTLLRTGVYLNTDAIIVELDKRIRDCLKEAKMQQTQIHH